jgi:hypothetical protein
MRGVAPGKIGQFSAHWAYVDRPSQAKEEEEEEVVELSKVFFSPFVHVVPLQPHLTIFFYIPFSVGATGPDWNVFQIVFFPSRAERNGGASKRFTV